MTTPRPDDDHSRRDEAALAPFFAAARLAPAEPSRDLLSAILADAGAVSAARAAPTAAAPAPARAPVRSPGPRGRFLALLSGWRVATALAAASVFGFWVGLNGTLDVTSDVAARVGWTSAATSDGDPVAGFFDLASAE